MATGRIKSGAWTYAGASTSQSQKLSYPETAKELLIEMVATSSGALYSGIFPIAQLPNVNRLFLGGYYGSAADFGFAIAQIDKSARTVSYYDLRYYQTTGGTCYVYYR